MWRLISRWSMKVSLISTMINPSTHASSTSVTLEISSLREKLVQVCKDHTSQVTVTKHDARGSGIQTNIEFSSRTAVKPGKVLHVSQDFQRWFCSSGLRDLDYDPRCFHDVSLQQEGVHRVWILPPSTKSLRTASDHVPRTHDDFGEQSGLSRSSWWYSRW